jgi:hypothetical protein
MEIMGWFVHGPEPCTKCPYVGDGIYRGGGKCENCGLEFDDEQHAAAVEHFTEAHGMKLLNNRWETHNHPSGRAIFQIDEYGTV